MTDTLQSSITDAQLRTLRNNRLGDITDEMLEKLSKEEATSIISDMNSGGFSRRSLAIGVTDFWARVKKHCEAK